nr:MAG TPA: hypothetical protein [Caudoviricetes sp.]
MLPEGNVSPQYNNIINPCLYIIRTVLSFTRNPLRT